MSSLLTKRYDMDHFFIGDEISNLMSSNTTGHPARIKCKLSMAELKDLARNARAGTLVPSDRTYRGSDQAGRMHMIECSPLPNSHPRDFYMILYNNF